MKKPLLSAVLLSAALSAHAGDEPLMQFRALNQAAVTQDVAAMEKLLADDFALIHITGYRQPKTEWLAEVQRGSMRYFSFKEVSAESDIRQDTATVLARTLVDAEIWGSRNTWRLQQTVLFKKIGGEWKITRSVATLY